MDKKSFLGFSFFFMVIFCSMVLANNNWWNFGNVGYNEGNSYVYFGSDIPSNHNLSNQRICEVVAPIKYTPLVADLNNDGLNEILVATSTNELRIYDFTCNYLVSFELGQNWLAAPVVRNVNGDVYLDDFAGGDRGD